MGGLILPYSLDLADPWSLGLQVEFAYVYDEGNSNYNLDVSHTAVIGYEITDKLGVYGEYLGVISDNYEAHFSTGLTYAFTPTFQWDAGAVLGLNNDSEDLNVFTGFTTKF